MGLLGEVQRKVMMGLTGRAAFSDQGGTHYLPLVELLHHTYSRMECVRMIRGTSVLTHVLFLFNRVGPTMDLMSIKNRDESYNESRVYDLIILY